MVHFTWRERSAIWNEKQRRSICQERIMKQTYRVAEKKAGERSLMAFQYLLEPDAYLSLGSMTHSE